MILVAGGAKGGSGKSTIATHLAIMRAHAKRDVLLVDADDQETAADFTVLRNAALEGGAGYTCIKLTGPAVRTEFTRLAPKYDDIVIDAGGRIIQIGSISGQRGNMGGIAYGASKAAVMHVCKVLAVELSGKGVMVNAIAPGPIETGISHHGSSRKQRGTLSDSSRLGV